MHPVSKIPNTGTLHQHAVFDLNTEINSVDMISESVAWCIM